MLRTYPRLLRALNLPPRRLLAAPTIEVSPSSTKVSYDDKVSPVFSFSSVAERYVSIIRDINTISPSKFVPFIISGVTLGYMTAETDIDLYRQMLKHEGLFEEIPGGGVAMQDHVTTIGQRSRALAGVTVPLKDQIAGWRGELYPVATRWGQPPMALVERSVAPYLGVRQWGVNVTGYIIKDDGSVHIWVSKEEENLNNQPTMRLGQMVSGGQPYAIDLVNNVRTICKTMASLSEDIAMFVQPTGLVSYTAEKDNQLVSKVAFTFDLLLPDDFTPTSPPLVPAPPTQPPETNAEAELEGTPNEQGEADTQSKQEQTQPITRVVEWECWPVEEVAENMATRPEQWHPEAILTNIDFMIRHGYLGPNTAADHYTQIVASLRCPYACATSTTLNETQMVATPAE